MSNKLEFTLPELDDLRGLTITKILVAVGDVIHLDQDILSLESEKTVLDVPSNLSGKVTEI
jgi:pyruvate/2-oxoglutarate dehydrogenase complex dihydrolipoamide acyltransferase (E2) component